MCGLKCSIRVVTIALIIQSGHLISTGTRNGTAEILWNLSQLAIQGRQNLDSKRYPSEFQLHPEKFSQYTGPIKPDPASRGQYGLLQNYPRPFPAFQRPHSGFHNFPGTNPGFQTPSFSTPYPPGFPRPIPALPPGYHQYQQNFGFPPQSFIDALNSVVRNDELGCVPRLLCELTSGPSSGKRADSILPFNINMESLLGVLSAVSGTQASPLLEFSKAALLGYTSKGNTRSCLYAYPQCPRDPDRLVEYLNNHNGGFFRFFNGVPQPGYPQNPQRPFLPHLFTQNRPPYRPQNPYYPQLQPQRPQYHPHNFNYYPREKVLAQRRILTQPTVPYLGITSKPGIKFPNKLRDELSNEVTPQQEPLVFPEQVNLNGFEQQVREHRDRKQKAVAFPVTDLDFQKPLPNFKQVSMIFPDRTGTGELRLDVEELQVNYNYGNRYSFPHATPATYYRKMPENNFGINPYFEDRKKLFRFPLTDQEV